MANTPKPWKVEYAKSSRAGCKTCKTTIGKEKLRLGKMIQATQFDGFIPVWHHASCIMKKSNQIKSIDDVEGAEVLRWEDQQKLRAYVETLGFSSTATAADIFTAQNIEISKTSRATCKMCNQKIVKGEVRVSTKPQSQVERGLSWQHANCFIKISPSIEVEKLSGWKELSASDKASLLALVKPSSAAEDKNIPQQSKTKGGSKRKSNVNCDGHVKAVKVEGDSSKNRKVFIDEPEERGMKQKGSDLERRLEAQSKDLWALKDDLKEHVSTLELKEMLGANDQDTSGSELDLRDRCADGMLFGALGTCPQCSGGIRYSGGMYKCLGYISEWSKCSYVTNKPHRIKGKWKIPNESHNKYLLKWSKLQKITKPTRVLPPSTKPPGNPSESLRNETLGDLRVALTGFSEESVENWKRKIEETSGLVHVKTKKDTTCLVVCGAPGDSNDEIKKAKKMNVGVVTEDYLVKCFEKSRKLALDAYRIECVEERVTVRVKGRSAVHESSGLQDSCHILEDGKSVYNTTLNLSDLSTGVNSYYILQIIKEDKGSGCYVFRKWGRIGNEKIGGKKIEEMSGEEDAVVEFKRLFLEKTGNPWEAWEEKDKFVKQAGRFYPLDIDYGADKGKPKEGLRQSSSSLLLSSPVVELLNMLFNVETYRATLMEFEINMNEMPLGKISKLNIKKGFEALTAIQNLLESSGGDPAAEESLLVDASNRFFMMIPSIHPHIIREEYELKSKLKMLEALQDIEIASRLVGFDDDGGDSLEHKYEKLQCAVLPVPHDTEDYRLIDKYLQMTHAPTHRDWTLELEDVFSLERQGEGDKYAATRSKLKNRMLLWHGSRVTNFVGILSQGLRIAPPEAPATGYMFGKGVYFADMASKSAQYCFTSKNSPVGLMLLSEVALGEIHPLKKATYMDKAPRGKHSTKGLGKTIPRESNFMTWRDGVIVPCGEPVPSNVRATELQYNEYIVYDTSQVKMQFLLKVRFHHKH